MTVNPSVPVAFILLLQSGTIGSLRIVIKVSLLAMKFLSANAHGAFFIMVLLALPATGFTDAFDPKAREGVRHYNREEFDQAATKFQESQLSKPESSGVTYNLANSLYRLGRYEEAVEVYKKTLSEKTPPELQQKSWYNMGNAYYRMGYMDEAINAYKKALKLNTGDMDSKFNLEWVRKQQEKARQAGRMGPRNKDILKQQGTSDHANNPPDTQAETPGNSQTTENQHQDKAGSADPSPSSPSEKEMTANAEDQAVEDALREMTQMTPEEAERWLGSLSEDLKKITRRQMQGQMKDVFADHDKDW
jgi:Ca-activated chloride channel homolog